MSNYGQREALRLLIQNTLLLLLLRKPIEVVVCTTFAGDLEALRQVKASVVPAAVSPSSCLGTWNFSVDPCDFSATNVFTCGFECDNADTSKRRVISLTLVGGGYKGSLSPFIGNLTALQVLDFSKNALQGSLPDSLGHLTLLQTLDISQNFLTGEIPGSLGNLPRLQLLSLAYNQLESKIPASFGSLLSLQALRLNDNRLTGSIPPVRSLNALRYLIASNNNLSGAVPADLPSALVQLSLSNNQLSGVVPSSLETLQELQVLDLRFNGLTGVLDASFFAHLAVQQVNVSYNHLTSIGNLRAGARAASQLVALDLSFNQIGGPLPAFLASLTQLSSLSLRYNKFTGPIPQEYAVKVTSAPTGQLPLTRLYLDGNFLSGQVPVLLLSSQTTELSGSLVNNCLESCPANFTLCQGGDQRPVTQCKSRR